MSSFNETHLVCIKLLQKANRAYEYAIALKVILDAGREGNYHFDNDFIELTRESMTSVLLLEVSKLFEFSETKSNKNCTVYRLRELCKDDRHLKNNPLVVEKLTNIIDSYKTLPILTVRNKLVAHNDLKSMFAYDGQPINIEDIMHLLENLIESLNYIFQCYFGVTAKFDKKKIIDKYKKSMEPFFVTASHS